MKAIITLFFAALITVAISSCSKMSPQTDYHRKSDTLDAHLYLNAWDYMKKRLGQDSVYKYMYYAIVYSGMDSNEYNQPNRTYIFLHNDAINRISSGKVQPDCYWGAKLVGGKAATKWSDYPKDSVKNYLYYLIMQGQYSHYSLGVRNTAVKTLMAQGVNTGNPSSVMNMKVLNNSPSNTQDYPIQINNAINVRTADLQPTNGFIHVVDRYINPGVIQ